MQSSTTVEKKWYPSIVGECKGPQMSMWSKSKGLGDKWLWDEKGNRFCFARGQIEQWSRELHKGSCNFSFINFSLAKEGCPSRKCQIFGLGILEGTKLQDEIELQLRFPKSKKYRLPSRLPVPIVLPWVRS